MSTTTNMASARRYPAAGKPKRLLKNQLVLLALAGIETKPVRWCIYTNGANIKWNELRAGDPPDEKNYAWCRMIAKGFGVVRWYRREGRFFSNVFSNTEFAGVTLDDLKGITEQLVAESLLDWDEEAP